MMVFSVRVLMMVFSVRVLMMVSSSLSKAAELKPLTRLVFVVLFDDDDDHHEDCQLREHSESMCRPHSECSNVVKETRQKEHFKR